MKQKTLYLALIAAILLAVALPGGALAAEPAGPIPPPETRIWLVHGISGVDMGSVYIQNPLDFSISGVGCYKSMMFMKTFGPIQVQPGTYTIAVAPAKPSAPCTEAPILTTVLTIDAGESFAAIAHLDSNGARRISYYKMDLTRTTSLNGKSRFNVANTAFTGPVDMYIRPQGRPTERVANDLYNPSMVSYTAWSGRWKWWFSDTTGTILLLGPMQLNTVTHYAYYFFLVGSQANGIYTASFSVNTKP